MAKSAPGVPSRSEIFQAFRAFRRSVMRDATRHTVRFLHGSNVTVAQVAALTAVRESGTQSISEIAAAIGLSLAATSQLVDRLVDAGMVRRAENPRDRRRKEVALTREGVAFLGRMDESSQIAAETIARDVPPELANRLVRVLWEVADALSAE
jgi:DNA-binding MarR family transcriptional regulator